MYDGRLKGFTGFEPCTSPYKEIKTLLPFYRRQECRYLLARPQSTKKLGEQLDLDDSKLVSHTVISNVAINTPHIVTSGIPCFGKKTKSLKHVPWS